MRFSVVAPNWNEMPQFQTMFLESLAKQSVKDFEVIIVDGGSTDGSKNAIEGYPYLVKWVHDSTHNIGYIRNVGADYAQGDLMLQTSSDIAYKETFLEDLDKYFRDNPDVVALGGRTKPVGEGASTLCKLAYWGFDSLRWFYTCPIVPSKWRKMRPAGNFLCIYTDLFHELGGYPEVKINEDGLFGYKLDDYCKESGLRSVFSLDHSVDHNVKRFTGKGLGGIWYYLYVVCNFFPVFEPILKPWEQKRAEQFSTRSDLVEAVHD